MTVGIVGLGLIGGSFAKAYHEAGHRVLAFDTDQSVFDFAVLSGAVDGLLSEESLSSCDLILIAVYPSAAVEYLRQNGYEQYEISNFARPGHASRHNLKYWTLGEYAGFGPGAHSDMGGVRFAYERDLDSYIAGELRLSEMEEIPPLDRDLEYIMLSLRTTQGIDSKYFERQFRQKFQPMEDLLVQYEAHGFAARTEKGWRLTPRGFFVSNAIIVSLQEAVGRERQRKLCRAAEGDFTVEV